MKNSSADLNNSLILIFIVLLIHKQNNSKPTIFEMICIIQDLNSQKDAMKY